MEDWTRNQYKMHSCCLCATIHRNILYCKLKKEISYFLIYISQKWMAHFFCGQIKIKKERKTHSFHVQEKHIRQTYKEKMRNVVTVYEKKYSFISCPTCVGHVPEIYSFRLVVCNQGAFSPRAMLCNLWASHKNLFFFPCTKCEIPLIGTLNPRCLGL